MINITLALSEAPKKTMNNIETSGARSQKDRRYSTWSRDVSTVTRAYSSHSILISLELFPMWLFLATSLYSKGQSAESLNTEYSQSLHDKREQSL